jgi:hypothetical protein
VIFHGYARLTGDADLFYDRDPANADRLFRALTEFWDGPIPGVATAAELAAPGVIIQFGVPPNRIDLINEVDGVSFGAAWRSRVEAILRTSTTWRTCEGLENGTDRVSGSSPSDLRALVRADRLGRDGTLASVVPHRPANAP